MTSSNPKTPMKADKTSASTADPQKTPAARAGKSGRVSFDDRGNAVWEWSASTGKFAKSDSTQKLRQLMETELSIAEDASPAGAKIAINTSGAKKGYDPYESGRLAKAAKPRKKDLRKLGEWLNLVEQAKKNKESQS